MLCRICGQPVRSKRSAYCISCGHLADRFQSEHLPSPAVKAIWDYVRKHGLTCHYTGLRLELEDCNSPWHLSFDHRIPGDKNDIVLTCVLFNEMKTDLTEDEFWYYILQLDNYKQRHTKVRKKKLSRWYRLYPPRDM